MENLAAAKKLDAAALTEIKQDLLQIVFVYLHSKEIQATQLFANETSESLARQSTDSLMNMMRWQVYIISTTLDYVSEVEASDSIVSRAKAFVHEHYKEDISRTEIAESVYLTPEYMAKMFKKETGISLKQYITDFRIDKAKELLSRADVRISDVATEVGFDNFSYFSTVFKKNTGLTPNEYHNQTNG
jgi:two-component system response regulator YesN